MRRPKGWTPELGKRIACEAFKYAGDSYDYKLIVADAASYSIAGRLLNKITKDALDSVLTDIADSRGAVICDELAALAMQAQPELHQLGTLKDPARENNPQRLFGDDDLFDADVTMIPGTPNA